MNTQTSDSIWHNQLILALAHNQIESCTFTENEFQLLKINDRFLIHLISFNNKFVPNDLIALQKNYHQKNARLVHLWEDIWLSRPKLVLARLMSLLGKNIRIHGRKTKAHKIIKPVSDSFLNENHLQGAVSSRYKIGLFEKEELVAVATFSALRKMNHTENYKSAELIRFAVKAGFSITGGLSKLILYFTKCYQPNDLMTYSDCDWSAGEAYAKLGFTQTAVLEPQFYLIDENLNRKLKKNDQISVMEVFNTGSLKFILKF